MHWPLRHTNTFFLIYGRTVFFMTEFFLYAAISIFYYYLLWFPLKREWDIKCMIMCICFCSGRSADHPHIQLSSTSFTIQSFLVLDSRSHRRSVYNLIFFLFFWKKQETLQEQKAFISGRKTLSNDTIVVYEAMYHRPS